MINPPVIRLKYRPVRIGWVVEGRELGNLVTAASWNTCLWGGRFNPIIPIDDVDLATNLIRTFGVDVLIPVAASEETKAFTDRFPHLNMELFHAGIFNNGRCDFADVRHAARRATAPGNVYVYETVSSMLRPTWPQDDPLNAMLSVLIGCYPDSNDIGMDYPRGISGLLEIRDRALNREAELPPTIAESLLPISLTTYAISRRGNPGGLLNPRTSPGIVFGDASNFDDLLLFWNLRAAGADVWFYDQAQRNRLRPCTDAFLRVLLAKMANVSNAPKGINLWFRMEQWPSPEQLQTDLDLSGFSQSLHLGGGNTPWNGFNIIPVRPAFSLWYREVIANSREDEDRVKAEFSLPDQPFNFEDPTAFGQRFIVSVEASQYGPAPEDLTFSTPYVSSLNDFYRENFQFGFSEARVELGSNGRGAVGIVSTVGDQRLQISAIRVYKWIQAFFSSFGITVERSEPGRRCSRLIKQLDGLQGCRVLKIRGARELIRKYRADQSFTRSGALCCIRDFDPNTNKAGFDEFEDLYIERREGGKLRPEDVFHYLLSRRVFRTGLEFKCPNCELESWIHLDEVKTFSTCLYCGHQFDVAPQLKDRDWRYRRSGLFGRDDNQLGGIPVALALQQLDANQHDSLLFYTTALNFDSQGTTIEKCEADFVAVLASRFHPDRGRVQILIGEAKTSDQINGEDVRKLGKLANAIPSDTAEPFIMFAKTTTFTPDEVKLARGLNLPGRGRVILWSREQLEPYLVYERSRDRLGGRAYASSLADMVDATNRLWP